MGSLCQRRYGSFQRKFETDTGWRQPKDHFRRNRRAFDLVLRICRAPSQSPPPIVSQDASATSIIIRCRPPRARRRHSVRQRRVSSRRFVWPVLLTLIGGWVVHTSQRTPFGFLQALVWLAVVIFVWAHALWRRRG